MGQDPTSLMVVMVMVMISLRFQQQPPFMISCAMLALSFLPPRFREQFTFPKSGGIKGVSLAMREPEDTALSLINAFAGKCEHQVGGGEKRRMVLNDLCLLRSLN